MTEKPPFKRGPRPPKRESAPRPKEQSVFHHPDANIKVPEKTSRYTPNKSPERPSPWSQPEGGPPARASSPRATGERPQRGYAGSPERATPSGADRPQRSERPSAPRGERPSYADRAARPATPRSDSPYGGGRAERARPYESRGDRPAHAPRSALAVPPEAAIDGDDQQIHAQRRREARIYGRAAVMAVAEDRFEAIRKLYVTRQRARELAPLLARLAAARVGFNEVEEADLERLTSSQHHEGVACDIVKKEQPTLAELVASLAHQDGPVCLIALDGVGNPHNFGAILRSAAHFGARAVLIPEDSTLTMAGSVYRVAEGAAERVAVVRFPDLAALEGYDLDLVAMTGQGERSLYRDPLPARSIILFGAEGAGLSPDSLKRADARYAIPGSGRVDSLNVAQSVAVVLGEWWREAKL
jgi:TrmH RNA methyltransferase